MNNRAGMKIAPVNAAGTKKEAHAYSGTQMQTNAADLKVSPFYLCLRSTNDLHQRYSYRITPAVKKPKIPMFSGTPNGREVCLTALRPGLMNHCQNVCVDIEVISPSS